MSKILYSELVNCIFGSKLGSLHKHLSMNRILIVFALALSNFILAQTSTVESINSFDEFIEFSKKSKWKQARERQGVSIYYRNLNLFNEIKTRQIAARFKLKSSSIDSIVAQIKQPNKIESWNEAVREVKLLQNNDLDWISHTVYEIPFPFTQQDLVAHYFLEKKNDKLIISSKSLPDYIDAKDGFRREGVSFSQWKLIPLENGELFVEYSALTLSNTRIPAFIKDPIIQQKLLNSFIKFKS